MGFTCVLQGAGLHSSLDLLSNLWLNTRNETLKKSVQLKVKGNLCSQKDLFTWGYHWISGSALNSIWTQNEKHSDLCHSPPCMCVVFLKCEQTSENSGQGQASSSTGAKRMSINTLSAFVSSQFSVRHSVEEWWAGRKEVASLLSSDHSCRLTSSGGPSVTSTSCKTPCCFV